MAGSAGISKIKIRLGQIEIDYEGAHDFLKQDLPKLLAAVVELRQKAGGADDEPDVEEKKKPNPKGKTSYGTVTAIAAKMGVKKGPELIIAAATKLNVVDGRDRFSRDELIAAMKSASSYYKKSYLSNLSAQLKTLLDNGRLTEPATDHYTLTASEVQQVSGRLAG